MNKSNFIKIIVFGITITSILFINLALKNEPKIQFKKVAITQLVEHPALDATYRGIVDELRDQGYIPGKNIILLNESAQGSGVIAAQIAHKFVGEKPDVMVGIATISAQALASGAKGKKIPLVFASITDPVSAQLVPDLKNTINNHITGVSNWVELEPQLKKFKEILPTLKTLGFIYNPGEANSIVLLDSLKVIAKDMGIKVIGSPATASSEVNMATEAIINKVDAIFISNDNTALSAFRGIVTVANAAGIPVFVSDTDMVECGAVAALGPNQYALGRQAGKMIVDILKGTNPGSIPVAFPEKMEFYLNTEAMAKINLELTENIKSSADKIVSGNRCTQR